MIKLDLSCFLNCGSYWIFLNDLILPTALWPRGRQRLRKMNTRNLPEVKWRPAAEVWQPFMTLLFRQCLSLDVSQPYGPPRSVEVEVNLRPTVSRPVCLGVWHPSGTRDQFFFLLEISFRQLRGCYFVAPSLTRGRVCNLLHNCFWALPEQSLLGRSPAELTTIFYCLVWDSPNLEDQVPVFISPRNRVA
jgi:hypothetical protein